MRGVSSNSYGGSERVSAAAPGQCSQKNLALPLALGCFSRAVAMGKPLGLVHFRTEHRNLSPLWSDAQIIHGLQDELDEAKTEMAVPVKEPRPRPLTRVAQRRAGLKQSNSGTTLYLIDAPVNLTGGAENSFPLVSSAGS